MSKYLLIASLYLLPVVSNAAEQAHASVIDLTNSWIGYVGIAVFFIAYILAMFEESTMLRKSKPMVFAASTIWALIGLTYSNLGLGEQSGLAFRSSLENFAELFLFILVSMTYLNAMEQRGIFDSLRFWMINMGLGYRQLFWVSGLLSFVMSSVLNNLTTALLMGAVVMAMAKDHRRFIALACVNIVVATNAGGSFSPFGDITTLLVWQKEVVPFSDFFRLLLPALVNYMVPALIMTFWVPKGRPKSSGECLPLRRGALGIILLFCLTIATAVCFENSLSLPPAAGMLAGLSYLSFYFYYLFYTHPCADEKVVREERYKDPEDLLAETAVEAPGDSHFFDVFHNVSKLEWDTLLFFYGVMVSVGGLSFMGYLSKASEVIYTDLSPTLANILVGIVSAFIDNGTIMYAVLTMAPDISEGQWLLVTLTAGVGGSLLAIGSAAGVGLLGQTRGAYSFLSHLKWTPVIVLGYAASIATHFLVNGKFF